MDKKNKWLVIGAVALIMVVFVAMAIFSPFRDKKDTKETTSQEKVTLEDIVNTASNDTSVSESDISAKPVDNADVIIPADDTKSKPTEYPDRYNDIWLTDYNGTQSVIIDGEVWFREELEDLMTPEEIMDEVARANEHEKKKWEDWKNSEEGKEYLALHPITVYMSGYPVEGTYFSDDVPLAMSIAVLELQHERFIPWLVEQGFKDEIYLLYSHTKTYDVRLSPDKYGTDESLFYVLDKDLMAEWDRTQDKELLKDRQKIWVIFNEWDGKLEFKLE